MNIGFDAKRIYQNNTGLGHYSRTLVSSLAEFFPGNEYFLFAPKQTAMYHSPAKHIHTVIPQSFPGNLLRAAWRSKWMVKDIVRNHIDLYHGLSHEIPLNIQHTKTRSVVTIHDLIFERYPAQYKKIDVAIYRKKFRYACAHADAVIAISKQTKDDLVDFYGVPADKITVCYQSCNPAFAILATVEEKERIRKLYGLPQQYFLSVGSVIERKNLLTVCKALKLLQGKLSIPLIVIGGGGAYKDKVKQYLLENGLDRQVIFLGDNEAAQHSAGYKDSSHFPAIYQMATCLLYPSIFEGFGLPVLEALWSETPVITSNVSCMPETGGDAAVYISPFDADQMAAHMLAIATDKDMVTAMTQKGLAYAQKFTPQKCAAAVMDVYKKTML